MPYAALKPCSHPGCTQLVKHGRCARHQASAQPRDPTRQRLYNTAAWDRIRARQLAEHPWCAACLRANVYTPATDVDHLERHEGNPAKFFAGPFQSLCHRCHSSKTAAEVGLHGR